MLWASGWSMAPNATFNSKRFLSHHSQDKSTNTELYLQMHINTFYYGDVIMGKIASQITSLTIVYSTVYSDADQRKHPSSASLAFVRRIHRGPVNSPHKGPVTRKMFPFDDVIMSSKLYDFVIVLRSSFVLGKQNVWTHKLRKVHCFKRLRPETYLAKISRKVPFP